MNSTNATFNLLPFDTSHEQNQSTITRMELLEFWNDRFGTPLKYSKNILSGRKDLEKYGLSRAIYHKKLK